MHSPYLLQESCHLVLQPIMLGKTLWHYSFICCVFSKPCEGQQCCILYWCRFVGQTCCKYVADLPKDLSLLKFRKNTQMFSRVLSPWHLLNTKHNLQSIFFKLIQEKLFLFHYWIWTSQIPFDLCGQFILSTFFFCMKTVTNKFLGWYFSKFTRFEHIFKVLFH